MSGAASFDQARVWASSFRLPDVSPTEPPAVRMFPAETSGVLRFGDRPAEVWLQVVAYQPAKTLVVRQFVFVRTGEGSVAGCAVTEERSARWQPDLEPGLDVTAIETDPTLFAVSTAPAGTGGKRHDVVCRLRGEKLACVTTAAHPLASSLARPDGVRYRFQQRSSSAIERAWLPFEDGDVRVVDGDTAYAIVGRSSGWKGEAPSSFGLGTPIEPLTDTEARSWVGDYESDGVCVRASDWESAEWWAESFRCPPRRGGDPDFVGLTREKVSGSLSGMPVRTYMQGERYSASSCERGFVMVETPDAIVGCMIHEDVLQYGYLQSPTPVAGSFRTLGANRFEFRARHRWADAGGNDESAEWTVGCLLRGNRLGCASLRAVWVDNEFVDGKDVSRRHEATITKTDAGYRWQFGDKSYEVALTPGSSIVLYRSPEKLRAAEEERSR